MNWLIENHGLLAEIVLGVIGVATLVVKLTPTKADDRFMAQLTELLEKVALGGKK